MRINKKQFSKAILTILFTIISIVLINMFFNSLVTNGLSSLFTTNVYKEAFANTQKDLILIEIFRWTFILGSIATGYFQLEEERELAELDRMERIILRREGFVC